MGLGGRRQRTGKGMSELVSAEKPLRFSLMGKGCDCHDLGLCHVPPPVPCELESVKSHLPQEGTVSYE